MRQTGLFILTTPSCMLTGSLQTKQELFVSDHTPEPCPFSRLEGRFNGRNCSSVLKYMLAMQKDSDSVLCG